MTKQRDSTVHLIGLPGIKALEIKAVRIRNVTHASKILRTGKAITASGDDGAINIWKDDEGQWRCQSMRLRATLDSAKFEHLASVVQWLKTWLPKIRREG